MTLRVRDPEDMFQRDTKSALDRVLASIASGVLLENVQVTTDPTRIYHNLGQVPRGFLVVYSGTDVRVWVSGDVTTTFMTLDASVATTVSLWVF
jgi:hypothetical protein